MHRAFLSRDGNFTSHTVVTDMPTEDDPEYLFQGGILLFDRACPCDYPLTLVWFIDLLLFWDSSLSIIHKA